jgi:hypothetical protein
MNADLLAIHSALDAALGDTDISHIESDEELRQDVPVQWAAQKLMQFMQQAPKVDDAALATAIKKIRKLRLIDHVAIKDSPPPAITFLAIMKKGLDGAYDDEALEYIFRRFVKYYAEAQI